MEAFSKISSAMPVKAIATIAMANTTLKGVPGMSPAWCIQRRVVAHALDYDFRILDPRESILLAMELRAAISDATKAISGTTEHEWTEEKWMQLELPMKWS